MEALCQLLIEAAGKPARVATSTEDCVVVSFDGRGTAPSVVGARRRGDDLNLCLAVEGWIYFSFRELWSGAEIGRHSALFLLTEMGGFDTLASSLSYP